MIGYDNYSINHQLLVALPFCEMTGTVTHDIAKPHHILTLSGTPPTWNALANDFPYIDFDGATGPAALLQVDLQVTRTLQVDLQATQLWT